MGDINSGYETPGSTAYYDTKSNSWYYVPAPTAAAQQPTPQPAPVAPPPVAPQPTPVDPRQAYFQWLAQRTRLPWGMATNPNALMANASPQQMSGIIGLQGRAAMNSLPDQGPSPAFQSSYDQLVKNAYPKD